MFDTRVSIMKGNPCLFSASKIQVALTFYSDGLRKKYGHQYRSEITHTFDFWQIQSDSDTQKNLMT